MVRPLVAPELGLEFELDSSELDEGGYDEELWEDVVEGGGGVLELDGSSLVLVGDGAGVVLVVVGDGGVSVVVVVGVDEPSAKSHEPLITPSDSLAKKLKRPRERSRPP